MKYIVITLKSHSCIRSTFFYLYRLIQLDYIFTFWIYFYKHSIFAHLLYNFTYIRPTFLNLLYFFSKHTDLIVNFIALCFHSLYVLHLVIYFKFQFFYLLFIIRFNPTLIHSWILLAFF